MRYYHRPGHPKADALGYVSADDLAEIPMDAPQAIHANIMVDRFYEGVKATDGTDIGSRRKHREYMKAHDLAPADDFSPSWYANVHKQRQEEARKNRKEALHRAFYDIDRGKAPRRPRNDD